MGNVQARQSKRSSTKKQGEEDSSARHQHHQQPGNIKKCIRKKKRRQKAVATASTPQHTNTGKQLHYKLDGEHAALPTFTIGRSEDSQYDFQADMVINMDPDRDVQIQLSAVKAVQMGLEPEPCPRVTRRSAGLLWYFWDWVEVTAVFVREDENGKRVEEEVTAELEVATNADEYRRALKEHQENAKKRRCSRQKSAKTLQVVERTPMLKGGVLKLPICSPPMIQQHRK